ncbi:MAG: HRDC domain-containing protein, partial [Leptospiraceae bacterium]|nr:HRDC domain-containing protein [Leptospiraceae bacterium]
VNGVAKLGAPERGRFKAIFDIREEEAAAQNIAPFRLINNHEMIRMARQSPASISDLKRFKGHPRFFSRRSQDLLEAIRHAEPIERKRMPAPPVSEPGTEELFKELKNWRAQKADKRNLESGMILNNRVLKEIARQRPRSVDDLRSLNLMTDWKAENYGPDLLRIIAAAEGDPSTGSGS